MKPHLPLLLAVITAPLYAQGPALPPQMDVPQQAEMSGKGKCQPVHNGDIVHYSLDIRGTQYSRSVSAELHMREGHVYSKDHGLPEPDFRSLGGGGAATRDAKYGNLYHFTFRVPPDVMSGMYYGAGVFVTATDSFDPSSGAPVEVTNRTLKHVREFCLIVVSPYGDGNRRVVDFHGERVERVAYSPRSYTSSVYLPTAAASANTYPTPPSSTTYLPTATPGVYVPAPNPTAYTSPTTANTYHPTASSYAYPSTQVPYSAPVH